MCKICVLFLCLLIFLFHSSSVTGFQAVVYEYAAEMTYPLQEGISGGLVNWVSQVQSESNYSRISLSWTPLEL